MHIYFAQVAEQTQGNSLECEALWDNPAPQFTSIVE